jgi:hypothetical protein
VRQSSEFPEELKPFVSDIFGKAKAIQEQRQEEGFRPELTQQLASFTPDQQAAFTGIREQVGQTRPLFQEATNLVRGATRAATDPAEVAALMNPFLRNVTDIEKREAQRVADVKEQQLAAQAAQAGAFGGSRAAVLEAERQRNLAQQLGDIEARGRAAAFQDAQARLQNQFGREAAGAAQLSALGAAIPAQTFKELGALSGVGAAEQQQAQRALDIATQQAREEYGFPMQTLQDFQSILRGFPLPATTNVSRQTFSPAQPLATQLLGLGTGLAGLAGAAGAFKKAGGLVGAPVAMKNGGYVKLAGGGGLGQLMQGKLPSNRVRMGKTAYQDVSMSYLDTLTRNDLVDLLQDTKKMSEVGRLYNVDRIDVYDAIKNRDQVGRARIASDVTQAAKNLPGQLMSLGQSAADAIQQGFQAVAPDIPKSGMFADEAAALVDSAKNLIPQGDPRLGMDTAQRIDPTGMKGQTRVPASLLSAPQMAEEIVGSGPQGMMAEEAAAPTSLKDSIKSFLQKDFIGGTDYRQVQQDRPSELEDPSGFFSPVRGNPNLNRFSLQRAQEGFSKGLIAYPPELLSIQDPKERIAALSEHRDKILTDRGQQSSKLGAVVPRLENRPREVNPEMPFQGVVDVAKKAAEGFIPTTMMSKETNFESDPNINKALTETTAGMLSPDASDIDPDPVDNASFNIGDALDAEQKRADAVRTREEAEGAATKAAEPDGGAAADVKGGENQQFKRPTDGTTQGQVDYNAQIADLNNRDYSEKVKKMLGEPPKYEKGEEPDFTARAYLALANAGFALAGAKGTKSFGEAFGDAARVGIKDLTEIYKEKRKVEKELRQERNAQKRADYAAKLQRFDLAEQLRKTDLDILNKAADLKLKEERNEISREDADIRRKDMLSRTAMQNTERSIIDLQAKLDSKGQVLIKDVMAELSRLRKVGMKGATSIYGVDTRTATAAYNAQLPSVFQQFRGRVVKDGKVMSDAELASLLKISPTQTNKNPVMNVGKATVQRQ